MVALCRPHRPRGADGEAVTQRVSDEKAIAIARQHPETLPSLFAWRTDDEEDLSKHHFTAQDLAADLLAARAEIASLRAKLAAVCRAGETLMLDVDKHSTGAFLSADDLYDTITAAMVEEGWAKP